MKQIMQKMMLMVFGAVALPGCNIDNTELPNKQYYTSHDRSPSYRTEASYHTTGPAYHSDVTSGYNRDYQPPRTDSYSTSNKKANVRNDGYYSDNDLAPAAPAPARQSNGYYTSGDANNNN